jgi:hypothetical protein
MRLTAEEQRFLTKRARLVRTWPVVGAVLLTLLIALGLWLFLSRPMLANPFVVFARLESGSVPESQLVLMAAMLPVVVLLCIFVAITVVLFAFAVFSTEKRYLKLIERAPPETD